mmetsp:Transcript_29384/g.57253  ORF Transcript_29384/g.57253 Transcript_29384/m.57253 type:complete len:374 (-) Transcript_29384:317-1438(-)
MSRRRRLGRTIINIYNRKAETQPKGTLTRISESFGFAGKVLVTVVSGVVVYRLGYAAGFVRARIGTNGTTHQMPGKQPPVNKKDAKKVAVMELKGTIDSNDNLGKSKADILIAHLNQAYKMRNLQAIAIKFNTPGGSPVQSSLVAKHVQRCRAAHPTIPIYAFVEDVCASGGYYVASQCNEIVCDESSIIGSIGVVSPGMGFVGLADKLGIEDRTMTAGVNKRVGSSLKPWEDNDKAYMQRLLDKLHVHFIDTVKLGRGDKLKPEVAKAKMEQLYGDSMPSGCDGLFDGTFYEGTEAVEVGLADLTGDLRGFMKDRHPGAIVVPIKTNFYDRLLTRILPGMMTSAHGAFGDGRTGLDSLNVDSVALFPYLSWK